MTPSRSAPRVAVTSSGSVTSMQAAEEFRRLAVRLPLRGQLRLDAGRGAFAFLIPVELSWRKALTSTNTQTIACAMWCPPLGHASVARRG